MKCLALDVGSSTVKGAVLDVAQNAIGQVISRPFPGPIAGLQSQHFEVDPHAVECAARKVIESLRETAPDAERLYVAGQMGGLLLLGDDGNPQSNYLSWRDQRSLGPPGAERSVLAWMRKRLAGELFETLGRELQAGSTLTLLCWLSQQQSLPRHAIPVTIADYVIGRLCGTRGQMHATHAIGLLDLRTLDWHQEAFCAVGLADIAWPRLVRAVEPVGTCRFGDRELLVYGAYGDQQCALVGAELEQGELSINASTGSQVSRRVACLQPGDFQSRAYFYGDLLQTITHLPAGRSLSVLVDLLTELATAEGQPLQDPWGSIARLTSAGRAGAPRDRASELAVDLSFFASPFGFHGAITGITTENLTVGELFLAAFRSMADNYVRCAERLDPARSWKRGVLSGSLVRSVPSLRSSIAERFEVPLRDAASNEETLLGLLKLASETAPKTRGHLAGPGPAAILDQAVRRTR